MRGIFPQVSVLALQLISERTGQRRKFTYTRGPSCLGRVYLLLRIMLVKWIQRLIQRVTAMYYCHAIGGDHSPC